MTKAKMDLLSLKISVTNGHFPPSDVMSDLFAYVCKLGFKATSK